LAGDLALGELDGGVDHASPVSAVMNLAMAKVPTRVPCLSTSGLKMVARRPRCRQPAAHQRR
jgi:hypothetical protein